MGIEKKVEEEKRGCMNCDKGVYFFLAVNRVCGSFVASRAVFIVRQQQKGNNGRSFSLSSPRLSFATAWEMYSLCCLAGLGKGALPSVVNCLCAQRMPAPASTHPHVQHHIHRTH